MSKGATDLPRRPIRTAFLVRADSEDRVRAALASGADAVYLDLESVAEDRLDDARSIVRRIVAEEHTPALLVRVNALDSGLTLDDLEAAVAPRLYGIVLPKIRRSHDVVALDVLLGFLERRTGVPPGRTVIHPIIETAQALRRAYRIGRSSPRVAHMGGVSAPGGDISRALGFRWTAEGLETLYLRAKVLADARAAGVRYPISGLAPVEDDPDATVRIAEAARNLGYQGMLVAYASHVEAVNRVFTPGPKQIERWQGIVAAAQPPGRRPDAPTLQWAKDNLELARRLGLIER